MKTILLVAAVLGLLGQTESVPPWLTTISDLGVVAVLLILFWGIAIKNPPWLVRYGEFKASVDREEFYRDIAHRATGASEKSAAVLSKAVDIDRN